MPLPLGLARERYDEIGPANHGGPHRDVSMKQGTPVATMLTWAKQR